MRKLIISGAGGFLGGAIIERCLRETDYRVYAISSQNEKLIALHGADDRFHIADRESAKERKCLYRGAVLVNCAFPRNTDGKSMADGLRYIADLLEESVRDGIDAVINISSQSVYSQKRKESADEETELDLESKYAVGKYASELLTDTICGNIPHTNIRLSSLLGVGFEQRFVNKMIKQVLEGKNLYITGGMQQFSFLDVRDAAEALLRLIDSDIFSWSDVYNVGKSESYGLSEIAEMIETVGEIFTGKRTDIMVNENADWQNSAVNCKKFMEHFGWKPIYSMEDTIKYIYQQYTRET